MADAGGVHRLPRQIPVKLAMELILTGRLVEAPTALRMGLVNAVTPASELMPAATALATEILECSPLAVQAAKQAIMLGRQMPERDAVAAQFSLFELLRKSPDFLEGPRAFSEKRKPNWVGLDRVLS
jgi:enoyl-CoA hydratase/carnithine racemase